MVLGTGAVGVLETNYAICAVYLATAAGGRQLWDVAKPLPAGWSISECTPPPPPACSYLFCPPTGTAPPAPPSPRAALRVATAAGSGGHDPLPLRPPAPSCAPLCPPARSCMRRPPPHPPPQTPRAAVRDATLLAVVGSGLRRVVHGVQRVILEPALAARHESQTTQGGSQGGPLGKAGAAGAAGAAVAVAAVAAGVAGQGAAGLAHVGSGSAAEGDRLVVAGDGEHSAGSKQLGPGRAAWHLAQCCGLLGAGAALLYAVGAGGGGVGECRWARAHAGTPSYNGLQR
jgi:hypothetical protein